MDDNFIFEFLEKLKPNHPGNRINILPILSEFYKRPESENEARKLLGTINNFLEALKEKKYIYFVSGESNKLLNIDVRPSSVWLGSNTFNASIEIDGLNALRDEEDRKKQIEVHQSAIDVNKSIIETNQSVKDTNTSIINISIKQSDTNEKIADNYKVQTNILKSQRWILWASVFVSLCSVVISYFSYRKDVPNNRLQQELKTTNQRLDTLQIELSQIKKNTLPAIMAKKTATKTTADSGSKRADTPIKRHGD